MLKLKKDIRGKVVRFEFIFSLAKSMFCLFVCLFDKCTSIMTDITSRKNWAY